MSICVALRSAVHAFRREEELQTHRASKRRNRFEQVCFCSFRNLLRIEMKSNIAINDKRLVNFWCNWSLLCSCRIKIITVPYHMLTNQGAEVFNFHLLWLSVLLSRLFVVSFIVFYLITFIFSCVYLIFLRDCFRVIRGRLHVLLAVKLL